jgi:hypothetical protein
MQESKWVKAEDLALDDEIRFVEPIWDVDRGRYSSRYREIKGIIVKLGPGQATLSTAEGLIRKHITTIEKFNPERLERGGSGREPTVPLKKPKKHRVFHDPLFEEMERTIARDDAYYRRLERQEQLEHDQDK